MEFDLLKYMSNRLKEDEGGSEESGPIVTISRLYGCPAKKVAIGLSEKLNQKNLAAGKITQKWKFITKEILSESARELEMAPKQIKYIFDYEQKSIIDDILSSHSLKYYKSDRKIRNTIAKVIRNMAYEGRIIVVGRGGVAITRDIPKSLHINLEAPMEWRKVQVAQKDNLSLEEAEKHIIDIDKKRKQFREYFEGKNTDYTWFDITFNCMTQSVEEIVSIITKAVEVRKLL
ncbi:MAG: cytidylate kinase-like family protein [Bacteroidales bacterium]|nr:cytidylate kinase-like family protein [Bacteroidales bacterium]MBN2820800.1 cytidylate kinase-like family protein [Bacteroidales bacterium]